MFEKYKEVLLKVQKECDKKLGIEVYSLEYFKDSCRKYTKYVIDEENNIPYLDWLYQEVYNYLKYDI